MRGEGPAFAGLGVLEQTPIILEKILHGVSEPVLQWKPAMDRWSIAEVLAHLSDAEEVFRTRTRRMIEEKSPKLELFDQNAAYAAGKYSGGTGRDRLHKFCHERDRTLSWLRYLPADAMSRAGEHPELGKVTVGDLWHEWAFHDLGHIKQITELFRAKAFYPSMGAFRKYYTLKP